MNFLPLFEESVKKNFDKVAIVDQDGTRGFTYGELDKLSGQVAAKLSQAGVCPGDSVMIHMGRKSEYYFAYLGILKMGGVIVPVIEEYPEERIKYIDKDNFKCLYRAMYTLLATFQTSVFPESIFSMITRTMHTNMNIRTCLNRVHHRSGFIVPSRVVNPSC